ncbi:hypothetical protein ENSA7_59650 [Enhygromyxa salina]|uniref:Uncharacterized protein n=1 Tax=Enhygromyxa salina TaxID=215803 RepID=A0A2S9Y639_9BACT|nr:hypothetical protein ENSA7_59650 [Enhygromyxa salina]
MWRIVAGKCRETWPSFSAEELDADVMAELDELPRA